MASSLKNSTTTNGIVMALRDQLMQLAAQDPNVSRAVDAMEAQLGNAQIVPEDLTQAIQTLEFVIQNPQKYAEVRQAIIAAGIIPAEVIPEQFDGTLLVSLLIALYGLQDRLNQRGYGPTGPLAQPAQMNRGGALAAAGRGGDTELVHVNRREKEMLRRMGGQGSVNPNTGLREYKGGFWKTFSAIAPIALTFIAPGIGGAIGGALTGTAATSTAAGIAGGAALGAGFSAAGGEDPLKGAALGAVGGGLGKVIGSGVNKALGAGMSQGMENVVGSSIAGAGLNAATGEDIGRGAMMGAAGGVLENATGALGENVGDRAGAAISGAGSAAGRALVGGADAKTAGLAALMGGAGAGLNYKSPADQAVDGLNTEHEIGQGTAIGDDPVGWTQQKIADINANYDTYATPSYLDRVRINPITGAVEVAPAKYGTDLKYEPFSGSVPDAGSQVSGTAPVEPKSSGIFGTGISPATALGGGLLAYGALSSTPDVPTEEEFSTMSPEQEEYFSRPLTTWDWTAMRTDAANAGLDLNSFMARNWNLITAGAYDVPVEEEGYARGGALARYARGTGSGRADTINAKLSDGEYVIDAETVAMLGDGSGAEGARRLNQMRHQIRQHKGKALAEGKFSPDAKSPLEYMKGAR